MTGAMYAAIGGLKSHMSKLNVIGNNVANVNTYGYKAQRMTFMESIYTTSKSGSNGGVTRGGNNPSQIGYGCSVGSIDLNMSPSTYAPTGVGLDCMLTGEGFFMVGDKLEQKTEVETDDQTGITRITSSTWTGGITKGNEVSKMDLTRVGDFWVDPDGYICNRDNKVLFGFARVQNPNYPNANNPDEPSTIISTHLVPLRVPLSAAAPTEANGGIIPGADGAADKYNWEEGDPVYPFLSAATGGTNQYACPDIYTNKFTADGGAPVEGQSLYPVAKNTAEDSTSDVMPIQLKSMAVGPDGSITGIAPNGQTVVVGYVAIATVDSPDGVTHMDGHYYKAMGGAGNVRVSSLGLDLTGNGGVAYLGNQVAPGADAPEGTVGPNANDAILNEKKTQIKNGGLEASSTDVANEFAEMITTQRGYQANTRIVTVTDSMLEELVNMKR